MKYVSGRTYSKSLQPRGKGRVRIPYKREERGIDGHPESRDEILKFIENQNRQLLNFIEATTETEEEGLLLEEVVDEEVEHLEIEKFNEYIDSEVDSDEEELQRSEEFL